MEHRWGQRIGVDLPVRVTAHAFSTRTGRIANFSVSGAYIMADFELRLLSRITIAIEEPRRSKYDAPSVDAYVTRKYKDGIGIEWCQFAPPEISQLLQSFAVRPYSRPRKPEPPAAKALARISPPLLKHGI